MNDAIEIFRFDRCPACGNNTIEAYDKNSRPMQFTYAINTNNLKVLMDKGIYYFKCKNCNKEFLPEWLDKDNIRPVYNNSKILSILKLFNNK